jgi:hypothetical protein
LGDVPDFIKEDQQEKEAPKLEDLMPLIDLFKEQQREVGRLTSELDAATKAMQQTSRDKIPEIMRYAGYTELKVATRDVVKIKEVSIVTVPEDKEQVFFRWLVDRNEQDIIKLQFAFPRMPAERRQLLFDLLDANDFTFEFKEGVHYQTLQSYFRKLLGVNEEDRAEGIREGRYLHPDAVKDFASTFIYYETTIKAPKATSL